MVETVPATGLTVTCNILPLSHAGFWIEGMTFCRITQPSRFGVFMVTTFETDAADGWFCAAAALLYSGYFFVHTCLLTYYWLQTWWL